MSYVNFEVMRTATVGDVTVSLTREWLSYNDKSDCVYMLRDSRNSYASRISFEGEAVNAFESVVSDLKAVKVENINEVYESVSGELEGRVTRAPGNTYCVHTRVVGKPYGWQFQGRWAFPNVACDNLEEILNEN